MRNKIIIIIPGLLIILLLLINCDALDSFTKLTEEEWNLYNLPPEVVKVTPTPGSDISNDQSIIIQFSKSMDRHISSNFAEESGWSKTVYKDDTVTLVPSFGTWTTGDLSLGIYSCRDTHDNNMDNFNLYYNVP